MKTGKLSLTILAKRDLATAGSQPIDLEGRTIWIVDAHGYGKRFIVRSDEMLTAFVELQSAIHEFAVNSCRKRRHCQARTYMKIRRRPSRQEMHRSRIGNESGVVA